MASTADDMLQVFEQYYESLQAADFERAADQFTESVVYIHPPLYNDETHIRGRDSLLTYFKEIRGPTETRYHLERTVTGDDAVAGVGFVSGPEDDEPREYFVSYAAFRDARIEYYIGGLLGLS
jgi:hypothetical protein